MIKAIMQSLEAMDAYKAGPLENVLESVINKLYDVEKIKRHAWV